MIVKEKVLNVGGVQCPSLKDKEKNLKYALRKIEENRNKADLLVFPELYSTGYYMEKDYLRNNAESISGNFIESIRNCAKDNNMSILMPFLEKFQNKLFNSVAIIDNKGNLKGIKRKSINWKTELGFIEEGNLSRNFQIFEVDGLKLGVLICYEASFPELSRVLAKKGAELIVVTAFWGKWALNHWEIQLKARALDNNIFLLGVNGLQEDKTCGNSMLISPNGDIKKRLDFKEGVLIDQINIKDVYLTRREIPYYYDYEKYIYKNIKELKGLIRIIGKDM